MSDIKIADIDWAKAYKMADELSTPVGKTAMYLTTKKGKEALDFANHLKTANGKAAIKMATELETPIGKLAIQLWEREKQRSAGRSPNPSPKPSPKNKATSIPKNSKIEYCVSVAQGATKKRELSPDQKTVVPPKKPAVHFKPADEASVSSKPTSGDEGSVASFQMDDTDAKPKAVKQADDATKAKQVLSMITACDDYIRQVSKNHYGFDSKKNKVFGCFRGRAKFIELIYEPVHSAYKRARGKPEVYKAALLEFVGMIEKKWNLTADEKAHFLAMPKRGPSHLDA